MMTINRRRFLELMALSSAGLLGSRYLPAQTVTNNSSPSDSPPVLQCPTETGITVVWAVSRSATGTVEYGTAPDKLDRTAHGDIFGLKPFNSRFLQVRIDGLKPNTRYFYRTVTRPMKFEHAYSIKQEEPVAGEVFSFETSGAGTRSGTFSTINDTHNNQSTLKLLTDRLKQINSSYTVWNGDLVDSFDNENIAVEAVLRPANAAFAAQNPMLFVPGNHDYRGEWARNTPQALPAWEHNDPKDKKFGRNFVVRTGPLALIGLDTGEDKPDRHPAWAGLSYFEPYRVGQRDWLERALKSKAVASASFVVAFCHIPLFSPDPNANGGDTLEGYARFQRQANELWSPLLSKYGVQALITAHTHRFKYFPADQTRKWTQISGGGPQNTSTVIHGKAEGNTLEIIADDVIGNKELGRWQFKKR
ncbi:MAG: metallophosphoesterase [Prevotellaceae bacterium]|jgi:predicted phosphodiesterase|nr:metallophosphoesterase [Prevotellaceae bacterium]